MTLLSQDSRYWCYYGPQSVKMVDTGVIMDPNKLRW